MGTGLAVAAIFGGGEPEQLVEWVPQCFGDESDPKLAAFCATEPEAGSDVGRLPDPRASTTRPPTSGCSTARRRRPPTAASPNVHVVTAVSRSRARLSRPGRFHRPAGHAGPVAPGKIKKLGMRASHTADVFLDDVRVPGRCVLGGREALDERLARPARA